MDIALHWKKMLAINHLYLQSIHNDSKSFLRFICEYFRQKTKIRYIRILLTSFGKAGVTQNRVTDMKKGPKGKLIKDDHLDIWLDVDEGGLGVRGDFKRGICSGILTEAPILLSANEMTIRTRLIIKWVPESM